MYVAKIPESTTFDSRDYAHDRLCTGMRRIQGLKSHKGRTIAPYVFRDQSELSEGSIGMNASLEMTVRGFQGF